jgi:hypothetical protein
MENKNDIAKVDSAIATFHEEWINNRAMIAGARVVRAGGEKFLPRFPSVSEEQHAAIIARTTFFPGASQTLKGLMGLLFRKPPKLVCPKAQEDILDTITIKGDTIFDLAEDTAAEMLTVAFGVLLTDQPIGTGRKSLKAAIDNGERPRILVYPAESVLGVELGVVNNRQRPVRVRLLEDANTVRELLLIEGVYTVNVWRKSDTADWSISETFTPTRQGVPLDEIPVTVFNTNHRKFMPVSAPMFDVCDLNRSHYQKSATLTSCDFWLSNPIPWITGVKEATDKISVSPGSIWQVESPDAKIGMLEYQGGQVASLERRAEDARDAMATAGARILASEKTAGVEAAQTLEIRNAAQTATLDGVARVVERALNDQLKWVAWWEGLDEDAIHLTMNRDFGTSKLTAEERKQIVAEWQAGIYSKDTALLLLKGGNALPDDYDAVKDQALLSQEVQDRPPVIGDDPTT